MVYSASGKTIYAWRRGSELKHTYVGHVNNVRLLLPFGPHLISVDEKSIVKVALLLPQLNIKCGVYRLWLILRLFH